MRTVTFFNNKGRSGTTSTVYHVAYMLSELGIKTIVADLDPQSNLTSMFLTSERIEEVYENNAPVTIIDAIAPVENGEPAIPVHIEKVTEDLGLILGNLALSAFEDKLSEAWLKCLHGDHYSFKITSVFKTIIDEASQRFNAEIVLVDAGPNLGAINRAVAISSDYIVMPTASDLFSLQGIKSLGMSLNEWKKQWKQRKELKPQNLTVRIPENNACPAGYIVVQYSVKEIRPVKFYLKRADRVPSIFSKFVLGNNNEIIEEVDYDKNCIALLKNFRSLSYMSEEARKPIFLLKPADGALGAHVYAVQKSYEEFEALTRKILEKCPSPPASITIESIN